MTVIEKDYRCKDDRNDVLEVNVYPEDNDAALSINGGTYVILTEKKIRKLIKQLKKALPKKEKDVYTPDPGFDRENLTGNIRVGDRVTIKFTQTEDSIIGLVVDTDFDDDVMPLKVQTLEGDSRWPWLDAHTRVFKNK